MGRVGKLTYNKVVGAMATQHYFSDFVFGKISATHQFKAFSILKKKSVMVHPQSPSIQSMRESLFYQGHSL